MTFLGKLQTVADLLKDIQSDVEFEELKSNDQNRLVHAHHIVEMFAIILTNKKEAKLKHE
jgi:hypothetical protein